MIPGKASQKAPQKRVVYKVRRHYKLKPGSKLISREISIKTD